MASNPPVPGPPADLSKLLAAPVQITPVAPPPAAPAPPPKPGWQTTEFWLTLATTAWSLFSPAIPAAQKALIAGAATAVYTIARAVVKFGG